MLYNHRCRVWGLLLLLTSDASQRSANHIRDFVGRLKGY